MMTGRGPNDPITEMYIFESQQLLERLEALMMDGERAQALSPDAINEIFRHMHTLKGSASVMQHAGVAEVAHTVEDLFHDLREKPSAATDFAGLSDLVLRAVDFIKNDIGTFAAGDPVGSDSSALVGELKRRRDGFKPGAANRIARYRAGIRFREGDGMENVRAYQVVHRLKEQGQPCVSDPSDLIDEAASLPALRERGLRLEIRSDWNYERLHAFLSQTSSIEELTLNIADESVEVPMEGDEAEVEPRTLDDLRYQATERKENGKTGAMISVHVAKLDKLMDLVGELVIAEASVASSAGASDAGNARYSKAAGQLRKITGELRDVVMSIRMVPIGATFHKMRRVARDMCRKLEKDAEVVLVGEETELDKNMIDQISDPLMHLVRNALDHGIEAPEDRAAGGKARKGAITLEAKNTGGDVEIVVRDDGRGLDVEKLILRAKENGLIGDADGDVGDEAIYALIFHPGFSTKEQVTEFSGRGVGMDVVARNIESVGGAISVDSRPGEGTAITLRIPLTLAIIDGMNVRVGRSRYTVPTVSILESFRPRAADILIDPDGNEMIMLRGRCYPIARLEEPLRPEEGAAAFEQGIFVLLEHEGRRLCLFVDELLGQQQVVVKTLPPYIKRSIRKEGIAGCTLLGDGSISLILDVATVAGAGRRSGTPAQTFGR